jgi:putative membrane protein
MDSNTNNLSDYLAGERTMLAWIRTGLALMGFGFVVARFGLFSRELTKVGFQVSSRTGMSLWIGIGLVFLGIFTVSMAAIKHHWGVANIQRGGDYVTNFGSKIIWVVPILLVVFGGWMLVYLFSLQNV